MQDKIEALEAANNVLAEQVAALKTQLELAKAQGAATQKGLEEANEKLSQLQAKGSLSFADEKPKELPAPKPFKMGGKSFRFKYRRFLIEGDTILEKDLDEAKKKDLATKYPGLVEPVE